ncbi:hypothetical protein ABDK56_07510 [Sphingomonas sp. ASV193]|uniref:hypothetical protein n=1 Tax=Sphingomonas sp. ASV193 TaxID=3144405 RepID=UPI0032E87075
MSWRAMAPRDRRAGIALIASIGGAAVLTGLSAWVVRLLDRFGREHGEVRRAVVEALAASNYGLLGIIGTVLLSLGLAINRRSIRASAFGALVEADGGEAGETGVGADAHAGGAAGAGK